MASAAGWSRASFAPAGSATSGCSRRSRGPAGRVRARGCGGRGVRGRCAPDRGRPDDQPAVHRRADDRAARRRARRSRPGHRHRVRLPGGGPRGAGLRRSCRSSASRPRDERPRAPEALGYGDRSRSGSATAASATRPARRGDGILVAAAAPAVPTALREQLDPTAAGSSSRSAIATAASCSSSIRHGDTWTESNRRAGRVRAADRRGGVRARLTASRHGASTAARYTRPAMTHVFVAPHPDDVALSCGGLIAGLRELGQNVTILTVFSGAGRRGRRRRHSRPTSARRSASGRRRCGR